MDAFVTLCWQDTSDIVSDHGLDKHIRQTHLVPVGGKISDALEEFVELRGANN